MLYPTELRARAGVIASYATLSNLARMRRARKRARALRHALAEYELPAFTIVPGRPLGEVLAR